MEKLDESACEIYGDKVFGDHFKPISRAVAACVYLLCLGSKIVYVGQSASVHARVVVHRADKIFDRVFVFDSVTIEAMPAVNKCVASRRVSAIERFLILRFQPDYNYPADWNVIMEWIADLPAEIFTKLVSNFENPFIRTL